MRVTDAGRLVGAPDPGIDSVAVVLRIENVTEMITRADRLLESTPIFDSTITIWAPDRPPPDPVNKHRQRGNPAFRRRTPARALIGVETAVAPYVLIVATAPWTAGTRWVVRAKVRSAL
jgi:hypothetical protein